jgi:hypothetical protein
MRTWHRVELADRHAREEIQAHPRSSGIEGGVSAVGRYGIRLIAAACSRSRKSAIWKIKKEARVPKGFSKVRLILFALLAAFPSCNAVCLGMGVGLNMAEGYARAPGPEAGRGDGPRAGRLPGRRPSILR